MTSGDPNPEAVVPDGVGPGGEGTDGEGRRNARGTDSAVAAVDVAALAAVEIVGIYAADLMTAAAVKLGLFEGGDAHRDLAEARILITALAGFVDAVAPQVGHHHAAPLRDGLATLQRTFREYSPVPDPPGQGPGEKYTGPVV